MLKKIFLKFVIILDKLSSLIYVRRCICCGSVKEDKFLCSSCREKIQFRPAQKYREINGCSVYSCTVYDGAVKKLIHDFKYKSRKNLAFLFAELMFEYYSKLNLKDRCCLLSVPIHKNRMRERGYNHMDLALDEFSKLTGLEKNNKILLKRIKDTKKQYNLHIDERRKNIQGAFSASSACNTDKNAPLLILDDITSSGVTFEEIIKELKKNGYSNITALALASPNIK